MATDSTVLSEELVRPVFRARLGLYLLAVGIATLEVATADGPVVLLPITIAAALVAREQGRRGTLRQAWVLDMLFAVAIAWVSETPIGIAIVVGWGAVIGLIDPSRLWVYPVGIGLSGVATTALIQPGGLVWSMSAALRLVGVAVVAAFFVYMFRDVGDRLRGNERELRALFRRVPVALIRTSVDGLLLEKNRAAEEVFAGLTVGERLSDRYVEPASRLRFIEILTRDGVVHNYETLLRKSADETILAVISANAINDVDGELRYIESVVNDYTPLRATELERERLAVVIESTTDLVSVADADGSIQYANAAARDWVREHVGDEEFVRLGQAVPDEEESMIREALQANRSWAGTVAVPGRSGSRILSSSVHVVDRGGDFSVASISRDVTDEIATEKELKELLRAKNELVASISHEIRTPLSVVLGLSSELRDNYPDFDEETQREFAEHIAEQGQEMANIVEDLLVAARTDPGSLVMVPSTVDLSEELELVLRSLPNHKPDLVSQVDATCWGDPNRIRQILRNLITNARRYGGPTISVATRNSGDFVYLSVVDDGPGVSADAAATIFQPFERAHPAGTQPGSIGLGLSVSLDLAQRMGGDLTYGRTDGKTTFTLSLPVASAE